MSFQTESYLSSVPGPMTPRAYGRSPGLVLWAVIGAIFAAALVTLAGFGMLPGISIPMRQNRPLITTLSFGAGTLVLILMLMGVLWRGQFKVLIEGFQVTIYRAFRPVGQFDARQALVSTQVVKRSTNGVHSGTTRTLIVNINGLEQRFNCKQFSRKTFSDMVAHLHSLNLVATSVLEHDPASYQQRMPQRVLFTLDPSVYSARIVRLNILGGVGALIAVISTVLIFITLQSSSEDAIDNGGIWFFIGAFLGLAFLFVGFLGAASLAKTRRRTPRQIVVDGQGLNIDQHYFAFSLLSRIQATPPNYGLSQVQKLSLQSHQGGKTQFLLGINQASLGRVFPNYAEFIGALRQATAHLPGLVVMDLQ
ncbi:hypothetical protein FHU41_000202 [Psychromicrobium silvestre]|uniref:Bacterial PH domain n=1 Tax=Psychromicrobium silvestre TaxID=1645614 RepID=A0A7Y9S5E5_9MICC|nr:hypothetical protein [Psychromicrobium silvestre]NYE93981.1 hypothetical protein [Psychromicrobium silvestre]